MTTADAWASPRCRLRYDCNPSSLIRVPRCRARTPGRTQVSYATVETVGRFRLAKTSPDASSQVRMCVATHCEPIRRPTKVLGKNRCAHIYSGFSYRCNTVDAVRPGTRGQCVIRHRPSSASARIYPLPQTPHGVVPPDSECLVCRITVGLRATSSSAESRSVRHRTKRTEHI
jgi:hypothetical protein